MLVPLLRHIIDDAVGRALVEDLGLSGDITTAATVPIDVQARAVIAARKPGVVAGSDVACAAFAAVDASIELDGQTITRATNNFNDVIDKVTFTLKAATPLVSPPIIGLDIQSDTALVKSGMITEPFTNV